jgi:hypothetical protein
MDIVSIVDNFTKYIKRLLNIANDVVKGDSAKQVLLETAKRKVAIIAREDPLFLLENVGKYLYKYREVIHSNIEDFIQRPEEYIQSTELKEIDDIKSTNTSGDVQALTECFKLFKDKWTGYSADEKKVITKTIRHMLSEYCKYVVYSSQAQ